MIKFDQVFFYQFGFFVPEYWLEPEPKIITALLNAFDGTEFMPNTVQAMQLGPVTETRQVLNLVTKKSEWSIEFEPNRINLIKRLVSGIDDIGTVQEFTRDASRFCILLSKVIQKNANRLSYVTKGILPEMKDDELSSIRSKLQNLPTFYIENPPVEWTTRNVARYEVKINDNPELLNVITDINRVTIPRQMKGEKKELDRIEINFDINTYQKNKDQRFC